MQHFPLRPLTLLSLSLAIMASQASGQHYTQTNLTSDQSGVATNTDPHLVNAWGLFRGSSTPWWISDNGTGLSTLYDGAGAAKSLVVTVPTGDPTANPTGTPSGGIVNIGTGFDLAPNMPARFMWVTEDGTISGWNPAVNPTTAVIKVNTKSAAVFKGVALATVKTDSGMEATFLYAADFRGARVQVYDTNFHRIWLLPFAFRDDRIPRGYAPFNIQNLGGELYVTFARQDSARHDDVDGAGFGYVDVFSPTGFLLRRLQHGSWLNAPWGLAMAPGDFGIYSHDLLVGQFGSGQIAVYDPVTGRFLDLLRNASNNPIAIDGLWALSFGSGGTSGSATALYFTAGPDGEQHGLFGTLTPVENPLGNAQ
ncbi:MAG TPA: TIGR03118 family protein [Terracidiphilus sp.]|nr:TIGR03118 family protein [Terracidiphilus sp.]